MSPTGEALEAWLPRLDFEERSAVHVLQALLEAQALTERRLGASAQAALMDRLLWPRVEAELDRRSLVDRIMAPEISVRDFSDDLAETFYRINAEWIEDMFTLEENDITLLSNP